MSDVFEKYLGKNVKIEMVYDTRYFGIVTAIDSTFLTIQFTRKSGSQTVRKEDIKGITEINDDGGEQQ